MQTDTVVTVSISTNPERYIEDGTGQVKARVGYRDHGVTLVGWSGRFDRAVWTVVE